MFALLGLGVCFATPAAAQVAIRLSAAGLSSLTYNGTEFLSYGDFLVNGVQLTNGSGTVSANLNATSVTMDQNRQELTRSYDWGSIKVRYAAVSNRLNLTITTTNTSNSTIQAVFYEAINLRFPSAVQEYDGNTPLMGFNTGYPTLFTMSYGSGVMALANDDVTTPLAIGFPFSNDPPPTYTSFPLKINTTRQSYFPTFFPYVNRPIAPGASDQYTVSLRFGPPGSTAASLGADIYQSFAAAFPFQLNWTDRRPIGRIVLATPGANYPTNPRGWFIDPNVDTTTQSGVAAFQARLLAVADNSIAILQKANAQGVITWDIEGEQYPIALSYIGDPRVFATFAPEMAGVADAYFKKFRDAGLRVGVAIRPQQVTIAPDGKSGTQQDLPDPTQLLIDKITYAKTRWGATLFYVDSNGGPNDPMSASFFQRVAAAFPDVLIIPEHKNYQYYAYTGPYAELKQGNASAPTPIRSIYPKGFGVINISDGPVDQRYNDLVTAVSQGDILMFRSWYDDYGNAQMKSIYQVASGITPPTANITNPAAGSTLVGSVTVSASASGPAAISGVQFRLDGSVLGAEVTAPPYSVSLNTLAFPNGSHTLTATARDSAGNFGVSPSVSVSIGNPPAVSIVSPAAGASLSGAIAVSANASSVSGIAGVQFKLDAVNIGAEVLSSPYSVSLNTSLYANGSHALTATARDSQGLTATSASVSVSFSNASSGNSRIYYVSPNGNDGSDGLSPATAWRTTAKVSATVFQPGDQILFARGGEWHESLIASSDGASGNPITYASYGGGSKPKFWGSDILNNSNFQPVGGGIYRYAISTPVHSVLANHSVWFVDPQGQPMGAVPNSFIWDGTQLYINTGTSDPRTDGRIYSVCVREDVIFSNYRSHLVFRDLVGDESADASAGYVIRIMGSSDVLLENCEAYHGGRHLIASINSTGFVGKGLYAAYAMPRSDTTFYVSYSDASQGRSNDSSQYINCSGDHFENPGQRNYQIFYNHGTGLGPVLIQNMISHGGMLSVGQETPTTLVTIKGGLIENAPLQVFASHALFDGITITGQNGIIDTYGSDNIFQNIQLLNINPQFGGPTAYNTAIVMRNGALRNTIRFSTVFMDPGATSTATCLALGGKAMFTKWYGNIMMCNSRAVLNWAGSLDTADADQVDYNFYNSNATLNDVPFTQYQPAIDPHSLSGDPQFVNPASGNFSLQAGSPAIDRASLNPALSIQVPVDAAGNPRLQGNAFDMGAFESNFSGGASAVVSITAPANGATVSGSVTVSANATSGTGIAGVQFKLDGANLGTEVQTAPYAVSLNTTAYTNAAHTLTAVARDFSGLTTTSTAVSITVNNPPGVSITAPANGATISGSVTVSANATSGTGIAGVQFKLDGANLGAEVQTAPYAVSLNTTTYSNAGHTLIAVARDSGGVITTSTPVAVTISNPPAVSITAPANGVAVSGPVTVSATASSSAGIAGVQFKLDGANLGSEVQTPPYAVSLNTTAYSNAGHTLTAVARDSGGLTTTSTAVAITISNHPAVSITAPANGATVSGTVTVSANATSGAGIAGVQFKLDGANLGSEVQTPPYSVSLNTTTYTNAGHTLAAVARDTSGLTTPSTLVSIIIGNPPAVSITAPANGVTVSGLVTVSATASSSAGIAGVQFKLDGVNLGLELQTAPYAVTLNTPVYTNAGHTLTAVARDSGGVTTISTPVAITIANPPAVSITAPANGATISGTVTVSANATSGTGIAGVQFKLDGVNLGSEVQTAPYWVALNTKIYSNAARTLTAVARDASGLTASAAITVTLANVASAATFVNLDSSTKGSWKQVYGGDGNAIVNDAPKYPSYAAIAPKGPSAYTWISGTNDVRAVQMNAGGRIASTWYSYPGFTIDLNLTDGQTHQVAFYVMDWDAGNRVETIDIIDAGTGIVLDTKSVSAFTGGQYLVWSLAGHVIVRVTQVSGPNAILNAIFFGGPSSAPSTSTASFISPDTTTSGSWRGVYGSDGYSTVGDTVNYPAYASVSVNGQNDWIWAGSTADPRALQKSAGPDRIAATWYGSSFSIDVNLRDGKQHQIALYALDWDSGNRAQTIDVLDASTNDVLDTRNISGFTTGRYLTWTVSGHVVFRVTRTGGLNAVLSGLFFGSGGALPPTNSASYITSDLATSGSWKGEYGLDGYALVGDATKYPAYASVTPQGQFQYVWNASTSDGRALQKGAASDRVAGTWYSFQAFSMDVNITDGKSHQLGIYCLDWDNLNRAQTIDILDATTGSVLDTRPVTSFTGGQYLIWNISGHVTIRVTRTNGANAVVSGLFFR